VVEWIDMRREVTPFVVRALETARLTAGNLGAAEADPAHLLHALLAEEEGRAATLLAGAGTDLPAALAALGRLLPRGATPPGAGTPLGAAVKAVLDAAETLAADFALDQCVSSEVLLLALLRHEEPLRRRLEEHGLDMARLESTLQAEHGPTPLLDEPLRLLEPTERLDAARILDAAANRGREALRVLEDYTRFALDDAVLSRELKQLRHDLAAALDELPLVLLLESRETLRDVGAAIATDSEQHRHSLQAVVRANVKRLQEALRSLEEFGKLYGPDLGQKVEALRYRSYTLERALLLGADARRRLADARLQVLVSGSLCAAALDWTIHEAAAGGADVIQLREKKLDDRALLERARQVRRWTRQAGVLFIMNDRPDIARLVEADGVHLGQDDLPVKEARRILGGEALVGVSTHDLEQLRRAVLDGASYVGVGPTFPSVTKEFSELAGLDFVRQALAETSLPAFVIGGVNRDTIAAAVAAGARRVAVSHAVCQADDPRQAAAELRAALGS
jgi:thiamine-phosphate pyrophosphorylase